ncbi:hypothetical protein [Methanoregula sp.]|jgi:hypothetical protein|uniref:hypothetical protein n=1 Tax=Methanoregula sp. TaxID=2052170 RepID=UPI003C19A849
MRGRKAASLKDEAKKCAERMGYHWTDNTDPSVSFDGFMYRPSIMFAVKLKKHRYGLSYDCIIEQEFPEDVADFRALPIPPYIPRELWVRTQNERAYRRFYVPARYHCGDRREHSGKLPEHPLPGRVLEEGPVPD